MFIKFIHVPLFLISLAIGVLFVYLTHDEPTIIYVYPTPENSNKILYKDQVDNCYKSKPTIVKCSNDAKSIPAQV